jgi:P27 family predicted phage terminase small subunit
VLKSTETGGIYQNPYLHVANKAWDQVNKLLAQFGLTPAERTRVLAAIQDNEEDDLLTQLFDKVSDG